MQATVPTRGRLTASARSPSCRHSAVQSSRAEQIRKATWNNEQLACHATGLQASTSPDQTATHEQQRTAAQRASRGWVPGSAAQQPRTLCQTPPCLGLSKPAQRMPHEQQHWFVGKPPREPSSTGGLVPRAGTGDGCPNHGPCAAPPLVWRWGGEVAREEEGS